MKQQNIHQSSSANRIQLATALRDVLKNGYTRFHFQRDIMAGIIVGIVALPLSMALAIAVGVPPQYGLYTAIVAGICIALFGGSRHQVSGPTAAFVVILAPIVAQFGLGGLLLATMLAGVFLVLFGLLRMGRLIQYIPYTVVTGFTAGIAIVLATLQLKDFLGLDIKGTKIHFHEHLFAIINALPSARIGDIGIGLLTLAILIIWPRYFRKIPAALVAIGVAIGASLTAQILWPELSIATIQSKFSYTVGSEVFPGIPNMLPAFMSPLSFPGVDGQPLVITMELLRDIMPSAFAIAILGAIESLLSAVIAEGMSGQRYFPDGELIGQGIGNIFAPLFGGFAATGALARTATNVKSGGYSPIAAVIHGVFVLVTMVLLAPLLGYIPMAALAALLMIVAWNMSEIKHVVRIVKIAPRADIALLIICLVLTVIFDMVIAITAGIILGALLFMHQMADLNTVTIRSIRSSTRIDEVPDGVVFYEIDGPLFYGATQKLTQNLQFFDSDIHTVVIDMDAMPLIDTTGLVGLESVFERLHAANIRIVLMRLQSQPTCTLDKAGWLNRADWLTVCPTLDDTMSLLQTSSAR